MKIIDQSQYHIAVFKPHNMAVIGGQGVPRPTLLDLMRQKFGQQIYPVHRLDRVTCGLVLFARGMFAKHALENAFKRHLIKKTYLAIVQGIPDFKKKLVETHFSKQELNKKKGPQAIQSISDKGELAKTKFEVLDLLPNNLALIKAQPITGRMHQIRIHLSFLGLPILGDKLYGSKVIIKPQTIALCASNLEFPLPKGAKIIINAEHLFEIKNYIF
jgi:23S rRNA pseudouridine1911/1915/1917 synthase